MNSRPEPKLGVAAKQSAETLINTAARLHVGLTRKEAARFVINSNPGWFLQTPEGEYLDWVVHCEEARKGAEL